MQVMNNGSDLSILKHCIIFKKVSTKFSLLIQVQIVAWGYKKKRLQIIAHQSFHFLSYLQFIDIPFY